MSAIEIDKLSKHFGPIRAVHEVSFAVDQGEVLGFLGPNGAGKSTTMKMVAGYLTPSAGTARVLGHDVRKDPLSVKAAIGYLPEGAPAYPDMTPEGFLGFVANVRGLRGAMRREAIRDAVAKVQIEGVLRQPIETLSKGFKRRVGLAQAILHRPRVLIMDEPTDGLDPNQKHEVRTLIKAMARDTAIVLSTHILEEVESVCTRTVIIAKGSVVFDGTPAALQAKGRQHNAVRFTVRHVPLATIQRDLGGVPGLQTIEELPELTRPDSVTALAYAKNGHSIVADLGQACRARGWALDQLTVEQGRLDDVFRELTGFGKGVRS
jgi:ABC-2 type transport system ATP-binding protein